MNSTKTIGAATFHAISSYQTILLYHEMSILTAQEEKLGDADDFLNEVPFKSKDRYSI